MNRNEINRRKLFTQSGFLTFAHATAGDFNFGKASDQRLCIIMKPVDEKVQLCAHDIIFRVNRPQKELNGFERISFKRGEKKTLEFTPEDDSFAFWNDTKKQWTVEPGKFKILVGASSADIRVEKTINL